MNIVCIIATFLAALLIKHGFEKNLDGPVWLGILMLGFVVITQLYMAFENLVIAKINEL